MVCSSCGYENQAGHRFCGMCGTPLPQRPLTAPGAQSTLNFISAPRETTRSTSGPAIAVADQPSESGPNSVSASSEGSARAMVPDVPLHDYLRDFRYEPPSEPEEVTMRSEATPLRAAADEANGDGQPASAEAAELGLPTARIEGTDDDVRERLGLDASGPEAALPERPAYLQVAEPPKPARETAPKKKRTEVTISGPSFLGLTDPPTIEVEDEAEPDPVHAIRTKILKDGTYLEPPRSRWRWGISVVVVLLVIGLSFLEWRSQSTQSDNGPVELIKAKIDSLRHRGLGNAPETQPAPAANSRSAPAMQVEPQVQPGVLGSSNAATAPGDVTKQEASEPASASPTGSASSPDSSEPKPGQNAAAAAPPATNPQPAAGNNQGAGGDNAGSAAAPAAKPLQAEAATQKARSKENAATEPPKPAVPGAEEMAKAAGASDSAARAAWVWKAIAKANPVAPVELADMYIKGDGVPRSCEQALVLLKTAATKENAQARNRLAALYSSGTCVQRNRVEAFRWLSSALAANPNSQWAQQNRDQLWKQMTPEERARAERYR